MHPVTRFEKEHVATQAPDIRAGYIVRVHLRIKEGEKERVQVFEGMVIAKRGGKGIQSTFTVRKISHGIGVERVFPFYSPKIAKIEVVKVVKVRRAKLYYLRERTKKIRFKEQEDELEKFVASEVAVMEEKPKVAESEEKKEKKEEDSKK
jgi:large subunit ribosomal protein L19